MSQCPHHSSGVHCHLCQAAIQSDSPSFSFLCPGGWKRDPNFFEKLFSLKYINEDLCKNYNDYFVRAILTIPIRNSSNSFTWGVWVSQSKENFEYYRKNFGQDMQGRETFGWFSNALPYYDNTINLKTTLCFGEPGIRPCVHVEKTDHELSKDFYNGISKEKAEKILRAALEGVHI